MVFPWRRSEHFPRVPRSSQNGNSGKESSDRWIKENQWILAMSLWKVAFGLVYASWQRVTACPSGPPSLEGNIWKILIARSILIHGCHYLTMVNFSLNIYGVIVKLVMRAQNRGSPWMTSTRSVAEKHWKPIGSQSRHQKGVSFSNWWDRKGWQGCHMR